MAGLIPELGRNAPARYLDQALRVFVPGRVLEAIAVRGRRAGTRAAPLIPEGRKGRRR